MKKQITQLLKTIFLLGGMIGSSINSSACTTFRLSANDGTIVIGRTMEWGASNLMSNVCYVPKRYVFTGLTSDSLISGKKFESTYGFIGINGDSLEYFFDGMNEQGLVVSALFQGKSKYQSVPIIDSVNTISSVDVTAYLLSQFANVPEVINGIKLVNVVLGQVKGNQRQLDLHWMVTDSTGRSIVIEYLNGALALSENLLGVMTNDPSFTWHLTNVGNYLNIPDVLAPSSRNYTGIWKDTTIGRNGAGFELFGLPGDNTSPSRFIRAVVWTQIARPCKDGLDVMSEAFRILDNFQMPTKDGAGLSGQSTSVSGSQISFQSGDEIKFSVNKNNGIDMDASSKDSINPPLHSDTQWTTVWDTKNKVLYYHTQYKRQIRSVDLKKINFDNDARRILQMPMDKEPKQYVYDRTSDFIGLH